MKNSIEFIEFPGIDKDDYSNDKYYKDLIRIINIRIFILEPNSGVDHLILEWLIGLFINSAGKISIIRDNFIDTCLFLINKSDILNIKEKKEILSKILEIISRNLLSFNEHFPIEKINISTFSGIVLKKHLSLIDLFLDLTENPNETIKKCFLTYIKNKPKGFFKTIISLLEYTEKEFELDLYKENEIPKETYNKIYSSLNQYIDTNISMKEKEKK